MLGGGLSSLDLTLTREGPRLALMKDLGGAIEGSIRHP